MAKAHSPVRLQQTLMEAAALAGRLEHRSATEQLEYWADLGRSVSKYVNPDTLLAVASGLLQLKTEPARDTRIDPTTLFSTLEQRRASGDLTDIAPAHSIRYRSSLSQPGQLEQVHPDGQVVIGQFSGGQFQPFEH